ncbi:hypothetical protein KAI92_03945 [Candidatus Parcubacteria bacterium]|nr:hypothetical protein [Candidatus Parcubacteria bacterium]
MFNIVPLILILISLGIIITIIARKFSVLANLDVENIKAEKEAKFKEQIISNRLKRNFYKYYSRFIRMFRPVIAGIGSFFVILYTKLVDFKDNYNKGKEQKIETKENIIDRYFIKIEELIKNENSEEAEKKLIDIIGLDSQNVKAFKELGNIYMFKKAYAEAKQTLGHVVKLLEKSYDPNKVISGAETGEMNTQLAAAYFDLTLANKEIEDMDDAIDNIEKALSIEPNNPRYLDTKFEISIIKKDGKKAKEAYEKMKEVDPDNQRLYELGKKIEELKSNKKEF